MQRCKARSKRSGEQCKNYAIKNRTVCRMHGANGGPKTAEGLNRCKNAPTKHGCYTKEAIEELQLLYKLAKMDYHREHHNHEPATYSQKIIPDP